MVFGGFVCVPLSLWTVKLRIKFWKTFSLQVHVYQSDHLKMVCKVFLVVKIC